MLPSGWARLKVARLSQRLHYRRRWVGKGTRARATGASRRSCAWTRKGRERRKGQCCGSAPRCVRLRSGSRKGAGKHRIKPQAAPILPASALQGRLLGTQEEQEEEEEEEEVEEEETVCHRLRHHRIRRYFRLVSQRFLVRPHAGRRAC